MKSIAYAISCIATTILLTLLCGCSSGSSAADEPAPAPASATITLVAKGSGAASRALPTLASQGNEGLIYNATLLLYSKSLNDTDLSASDKVQYVYHQDFATAAASQSMEIPAFFTGNYYALAIVNDNAVAHPLSYWKDMLLTELRNQEYQGMPYMTSDEGDLSTFSKYVMVSDEERSINFIQSTISPSITVERLCARVDLKIQGLTSTTVDGQQIFTAPVYDLDQGESYAATGETIEITDVYIKNTNRESTYYIQRADGSYFSDEEFSDTHATKTVACPSSAGNDHLYGWLKSNNALGQIFCSGHQFSGNNDFYTLAYIGEYTGYDADTHACLEIDYLYTPASIGATPQSKTFEKAILHCTPSATDDITSWTTPYAVIRNTIYRFNVAFFSDAETVYIRWYYYSDTFDEAGTAYTTTTAFSKTITDGAGGNPKD